MIPAGTEKARLLEAVVDIDVAAEVEADVDGPCSGGDESYEGGDSKLRKRRWVRKELVHLLSASTTYHMVAAPNEASGRVARVEPAEARRSTSFGEEVVGGAMDGGTIDVRGVIEPVGG